MHDRLDVGVRDHGRQIGGQELRRRDHDAAGQAVQTDQGERRVQRTLGQEKEMAPLELMALGLYPAARRDVGEGRLAAVVQQRASRTTLATERRLGARRQARPRRLS